MQLAYNEEHGITPISITKGVSDIAEFLALEQPHVPSRAAAAAGKVEGMSREELEKLVITLEEEMFTAAEELRFEYAAKLRDEIKELRRELTRSRRGDRGVTRHDASGFVLAILFSGFITGALARLAIPGPDPMPIWLTIAIGLVGSIVGAVVGNAISDGNGYVVSFLSFGVAIALVAAYRRFVQKRPIFGPGALRVPGARRRRRAAARAAAEARRRPGRAARPTRSSSSARGSRRCCRSSTAPGCSTTTSSPRSARRSTQR